MERKRFILKLLNDNKETLRGIGIKSIGIFGSVVRGEDTEDSDYDIFVEFETKFRKFRSFSMLCDFLESHIGEKYDLITRDGLSPYFGEKILKEVKYVDINS
ncbi:MAG: nucleotidyltransferase family protein [SAR324 cluster bacterium]|nr:nucleotidyltransferase family protein [SAR324 cluster bacterium]